MDTLKNKKTISTIFSKFFQKKYSMEKSEKNVHIICAEMHFPSFSRSTMANILKHSETELLPSFLKHIFFEKNLTQKIWN